MSTPPSIRSIPPAYDAGEQAEYAAIRSGCAIDRIAPRALLEVAGDDAVAALLRALRFRLFDPGPADVRAAIILDGERMTAAATVVRRAPDRLLLDCSNPTAERLLEAAGIELLEHGDQLVRMRLRGPGLVAVLGGRAPGRGRPAHRLRARRRRARCCAAPAPIAPRSTAAAIAPARAGTRSLRSACCRSARPRSRRCVSRTPSRAWSATSRSRSPPPWPAWASSPPPTMRGCWSRSSTRGRRRWRGAKLRADGAEVGEIRVGARSVRRAGRAVALATVDRALAAPGPR